MSSVVIGASMAAAWLMPDEKSHATDKILTTLPSMTALVPTLFRHEILNVIVLALRRGRIDNEKAAALLRTLRGLPLDERVVNDDATVLSLAIDHGLTAYDAVYLLLAGESGSSLATLDGKLAAAARRLSIGLVGPLAP